jgi:hypothetical protein
MIRTLKQFGSHTQPVLHLEFGTGDIVMHKGTEIGKPYNSMLMFDNNTEPRQIGEVTNEHVGKTSDELPCPKMVMKFRKKESILAVIHSLQEIYDSFPDDLPLLESTVVDLDEVLKHD